MRHDTQYLIHYICYSISYTFYLTPRYWNLDTCILLLSTYYLLPVSLGADTYYLILTGTCFQILSIWTGYLKLAISCKKIVSFPSCRATHSCSFCYSFISHFSLLIWETTFDGRRSSMQDNRPRKTTYDGTQLSMEDDLQWKMTFDGRRPLMEDDLPWRITFDSRWHSMEDCLQWETTFNGRLLLMEDDLWWKKTFDGRQPLMEYDLWWKANFVGRLSFIEGRQPQKFKWTSAIMMFSKTYLIWKVGSIALSGVQNHFCSKLGSWDIS